MKKITSLSLGISFFIMTYTGIMLFICPHGRIAYWNNWTLWGLSKEQYGDLHTTSMLTIIIFGVLHIYYNWTPLLSYLKNKAHKISLTKKEFLIALSINSLFIIGTLFSAPPFSSFLKWENTIKKAWSNKYPAPPYGHAELSSLKVLCKRLNIDLTQALNNLKQHHIEGHANETIKIIANKSNLKPADILKIILE